MTNPLTTLNGTEKSEDTFEYWVYQASKGENVATCWQNCERIAELRRSRTLDLVSEEVEKMKELEQSKLEASVLLGDKMYHQGKFVLAEDLLSRIQELKDNK